MQAASLALKGHNHNKSSSIHDGSVGSSGGGGRKPGIRHSKVHDKHSFISELNDIREQSGVTRNVDSQDGNSEPWWLLQLSMHLRDGPRDETCRLAPGNLMRPKVYLPG